MFEHVSEDLWEAFWAKTLPTPELVRVAKHHSECGQCRAIAHEIFMRQRNYAPVVIDLSDDTWFKDDHLDLFENDLISAYVIGELDEDDRGWIDAHLRNCARCFDKIRQATDHRLRCT